MTEETLNIQIKASVQQAVDNINKVKKDLKGIDKEGGNSAKGVDKITKSLNDVKKASNQAKQGVEKAMGGIKKSVQSVLKTVASFALAAASLSEGIEFGKLQGKLNAAFQSAGSSAAQATKTFKELYRFLGDSDRAVETAQNLARITTNEKDLAEWTKILQGVYATMGDAIPVETLAESVNETAQVAKITGTLADALNWMGVSEDAVNSQLATMNTAQEREVYLRSLLNGLYSNAAAIYEQNSKAVLDYNQAQANLKIQLADVAAKLLPLITAFSNVAAVVLGILKPAIEVIVQVIATLCQWIITAINWLGAFFGIFSDGKASVSKTNDNINKATNSMKNYGSAIGGAAAAAKELRKQTMGFDELNVIQSPTATGGGGGGGGGSVPSIDSMDMSNVELPSLDDFNTSIDKAKKSVQALLVLIGSIAAAMWLIPRWEEVFALKNTLKAPELLKAKIRELGAELMIVAGTVLLIRGYFDAWVNGVDWGSLIEILTGLGLVLGGIGMLFGNVAVNLGLIMSGILLLVLGIKDLIENGYSMQAVIMVLIGAVATLIGVIWLLNAAMLANPITWIVAGIMALVAAFVILWNECEGFRNFWINLWDKIKNAVSIFIDWCKNAWQSIKTAVSDGINWIKEKVLVPISNFYIKWIKPPVDKCIEIISKMVEIVIGLYVGLFNLLVDKIIKPIAEWVSKTVNNIKDWIKGAVDTIKGWFSGLWSKIKEIFSPVANFFKSIWNNAFNAVKTVFSPIVNFFSGIWGKIKDKFSSLGTSIGDAIGGAVKAGINGVISLIENSINSAISLINGAIKLINLLPGVSVGYVQKLHMPRLAKGGIVDSATIAMVGEQGKEAVVPLENNTEWMDKLADRLAARIASPTRVSLNVDGKELGWTTINSINSITKQTGNLPLAVI